MKVITLLGTRPDIIKLAEISKCLDKHTDHIIVHTGQNYSEELNAVFYKGLGLRQPDYYLDCATERLGQTLGNIFDRFESVLIKEKPDAVLFLGDTNSALGAIVAKRHKIPLFHLEAGNRCFDDNTPEEVNRRLLDHISDINMVYSEEAWQNLLEEGVPLDRTFLVGSPMREVIEKNLPEPPISSRDVIIASIHREENLEPGRLDGIIEALATVSHTIGVKVELYAHPRLHKALSSGAIPINNNLIKLKTAVGWKKYINLQRSARCVISDSGTLAEESSILYLPAVSLRTTTERQEAVARGNLIISGLKPDDIVNAVQLATTLPVSCMPEEYSRSDVSAIVTRLIVSYTPYVRRYVYGLR